MNWQKAVFILLILFCLTPYGSPPIALALGLVVAFTFSNPFPSLAGKPIKYLMQTSIVLLGFGMELGAVFRTGRDGLVLTISTIFGTIILGLILGKMFNVQKKITALISSGTAICGGSAIAAVGPAINAEPDDMSVSLGTVFVLNAVALFLFPFVGIWLELSPLQFGTWAGVAIHDTSSVVGAAQTFGDEAVSIATTVKLSRALWIIPLVFLFAFMFRKKDDTSKAKLAIPWFIFLFVAAAAIRSFAPSFLLPSIFDSLVNLAKAGMTVTLFLIGASLTPKALRAVGLRPLALGVILWIMISLATLVSVAAFL